VRDPRRQGRSALLWGLASFAALQALLAVALETVCPELRDPMFGDKLLRLGARTSGHGRPYTVLMIGSSRCLYGFDAGRLDAPVSAAVGRPAVVFNFGIAGAGPVTELLTLQRLLGRGVRPDLLLIEVLPPRLSDLSEEAAMMPPVRLWWRDLPLVERYGAPADRLRAGWWEDWPVPWYKHRFAILSRALPYLLPDGLREDGIWGKGTDGAGWAANTLALTPAERRRAEARAREEYLGYLSDYRPGGPGARALREVLDVCRRERLPAVLVLMPEGSAFRGLYPPEARARLDAFLAGLRRDYAVPLIDAREWVPDGAFWDSHHLQADGAAAFTERLGPRLLEALPGAHMSTNGAPGSPASGSGRSARRALPAGPCQLPASGTQLLPP
jgi:hypothetical protein